MGVMDLRRGLMMAGASPGITPFYTGEFEFSTTSTTYVDAGSFNLGPAAYTSDKILLIQIRNKAGKRAGYFYGSDNVIVNPNGYRYQGDSVGVNIGTIGNIGYRFDVNGEAICKTNAFGIFVDEISNAGMLTLKARYQSSYSYTIDGTWEIKAYLLDFIGENPVANV